MDREIPDRVQSQSQIEPQRELLRVGLRLGYVVLHDYDDCGLQEPHSLRLSPLFVFARAIEETRKLQFKLRGKQFCFLTRTFKTMQDEFVQKYKYKLPSTVVPPSPYS